MSKAQKFILVALSILAICAGVVVSGELGTVSALAPPPKNPNDQGIGMQGTIPQAPPTTPAVISLPVDGATFTSNPITITGLCVDGLLIRVFRNDAFGGSVMCDSGHFSLQMDLFYGTNSLTAKVYDDLDQEGPLSNTVTVTYPPPAPGSVGSTEIPGQIPDRISLSSNYGRRGADPHTEMLWPIILTGGNGPYALSIEWADGSAPELMSQGGTGQFNIKHTYNAAGTYKVIVKATDKNGQSAFLQLVAVVNGTKTSSTNSANLNQTTTVRTKLLWQPAAALLPMMFIVFWLGRKYQLKKIRYRMKHHIFPIDR